MAEHLNIELKAKTAHENHIHEVRSFLKENNGKFIGEDHQIDTYFNTFNGRLKLREGNIEKSLIHYERSNSKESKESKVCLVHGDNLSEMKVLLLKSNGIKCIVDKKREIYFIENVKFHLDNVKGLGTFIEIEAIDFDGTIGKDKLLQQCQFYQEKLKIKKDDLIDVSYSDML